MCRHPIGVAVHALVFDLDGTLLHLDRPYEAVLRRAFEATCDTVDPAWLDTYTDVFADAFAGFETAPAAAAFAKTDAPGSSSGFADHLLDGEVDATEPPVYAHTDLDNLSARYSLGLLTNGPSDWQREKLRAAGLARYFDAVVASYDVTAHKPAVEPYRAVESMLGADAYAMVGDSDSDLDGAEAAGWRSVRYDDQRLALLPEAVGWP